MIRAQRGVGVGKSGRIPDFIGYTSDGKSIAIEVERTDKSLDRLKGIVVSYATQHEYDEVWFICGNQLIFNNFEKVGFDDKIKLYHLEDVLGRKELIYNRSLKMGSNGIVITNQVKEAKQENVVQVMAPVEVKQELKETIVTESPVEVLTIDENVQEVSAVNEKKDGKWFGKFKF